ncbi:MAG: voltage-gated chloride channel protein [Anaerocolumna sp.]|nr:voltage-gated chloride channel protein [Anaerocolumna sp.]
MIRLKEILGKYRDIFILGVISLFIGLLVGSIDSLFGRVLLEITDFRNKNIYYLIPLLPLAGLFIIFIYSKIGKNSIKGMSLLFSVGLKEEQSIPKRLVPLVIINTWITHLFGGSAGREGVAVQIGGTVAHSIGSKLKIKNSNRILLIAGMGAGFAGLFQTPIAGIFFAMEIFTAGVLEYRALFPCIIAAFTASFTSHALGLEKFSFNLTSVVHIDVLILLKIMLLGVLFGIVGSLFARLLNFSKSFFSKLIINPYLKIFIIGCVLSVLFLVLYRGRYSGLGTNLIEASFTNGKIYEFDWGLKFLLTIITYRFVFGSSSFWYYWIAD